MGTKLNSAPVFYTLAQFKFNPIAQISEYVPKLQDKLRRDGYPGFQLENMLEINIRRTEETQPEVQQSPQSRWSFTNAENTEGYLLFPDSLVFHTADYDTFSRFSEKALKGLKFVHDTVDLAFINRIGIRYLDAICPKPEEDISQYLVPSLLSLSSFQADNLKHAFSETAAQINGGTLISRAIITKGNIALPPDLVPIRLRLLEKTMRQDKLNAVLDTDYFIEQQIDISDFDLIKKQLNDSHSIASKAFRASVTKHATSAWK